MQLINKHDSMDPKSNSLPESAPPYDTEMDTKTIDLVFLMDSTGSMGTYIASAKRNIEKIASEIVQSEKISAEDLRMCLIAYRDHPPQDKTFVVRSFPFTSNAAQIKEDLAHQRASGGGDGPEAVTAAMNAALELEWRPNAAKIIVVIADAPPHGLGERNDGFPNGDPDGFDPLEIAHSMAQKGIVIYPVACEPTLSNSYLHGTDFFRSLSEITGGTMVPLTSASLLSNVIVGGTQEQLDLERLVREMGSEVATEVGRGRSEEEMVEKVHSRLERRGARMTQLVVDDVYMPSEEAAFNVRVWSRAENLSEARDKVKPVSEPRLKSEYLSSSSSFASTRGIRSEDRSEKRKSNRWSIRKVRGELTLGDDSEEEQEWKEVRCEPKVQSVEVSNAKVSVDQVKRMVKQSVSRGGVSSRYV